MDRIDEARVVVADDQTHAVEAATDKGPQERGSGRSLVIAARELNPEHAPLPTHRHTRCAAMAASTKTVHIPVGDVFSVDAAAADQRFVTVPHIAGVNRRSD